MDRHHHAQSNRWRIWIISIILLGNSVFLSAEDTEIRVLTLPETISIALRQNIGLQRSSLQVELGSNSVEASKGENQPNLNLSSSGNLVYSSPDDSSIFDKGGGDFDDSIRAGLSSSMTLYDGGSIKGAIAAAEADLEAAQNNYDRDRQILLLNTVTAFLQAIVREKQVEIGEEELVNQIEQLERIRLDYNNGIRVRSEVLRQEALVAQSRGILIEFRRLYSVSLFTLKDLLQIPAEVSISCADTAEGWKRADEMPPPDLSASLKTLANRLDLEAQRARMDSAKQSVRVAKAGKSVSLAATASLNTAYSSSMDGGFPERFFSTEPSASAGLVLNVPIFDRRRTQTNVLRSQIQLRQEELFYDDLLQIAQSDLYRAVLDFESAQAQLQAALDQLASADEALEAESARYDAGVATLLDLNSIRATRLDAAVAVEQARFDLFTSRLSVTFEDGTIEPFLLAQIKDLDPSIINVN